MTTNNPLIVALDVETKTQALHWVSLLKDAVTTFKVGSQLFTAEGPPLVQEIKQQSAEIFLDLKFHDIPNTVARACIEAARLGVAMITLHASGGLRMMESAAHEVSKFCSAQNLQRPKLLAVTVLTSLSNADLSGLGIPSAAADQVVRLARLAQRAGMDGVVASPHEVAAVRAACGKGFLIVTPGIRLSSDSLNDQSRVATPRAAIEAGADYLVVGRSILASQNPTQTVRKIQNEISLARAATSPRS